MEFNLEGMVIYDHTTWPLWFVCAWTGAVVLGMSILSIIVPEIWGGAPKIAIKGKHLDELEFTDMLFIGINKLLTALFVYHVVSVVYYTDSIKLQHDEASVANTLGSLVCFYALYDYLYMWFHRILHISALYPYVHKHHHRQKAPSRGNLDAINVHPFEFVVGEYLHLLTIYVVPCHVYAVAFFILAGGVLASLNHTRYDVNIPGLFSVKVHDVHHRLPQSNYAQYTMFWDKLHGSYRDYAHVKGSE